MAGKSVSIYLTADEADRVENSGADCAELLKEAISRLKPEFAAETRIVVSYNRSETLQMADLRQGIRPKTKEIKTVFNAIEQRFLDQLEIAKQIDSSNIKLEGHTLYVHLNEKNEDMKLDFTNDDDVDLFLDQVYQDLVSVLNEEKQEFDECVAQRKLDEEKREKYRAEKERISAEKERLEQEKDERYRAQLGRLNDWLAKNNNWAIIIENNPDTHRAQKFEYCVDVLTDVKTYTGRRNLQIVHLVEYEVDFAAFLIRTRKEILKSVKDAFSRQFGEDVIVELSGFKDDLYFSGGQYFAELFIGLCDGAQVPVRVEFPPEALKTIKEIED